MNIPNIDIENNSISHSININDIMNDIDNIANQHNMKKYEIINDSINNTIIHRYMYRYDENTNAPKTVDLKIIINKKTQEIKIQIADIFKIKQSQVSKEIEKKIIEMFKTKYDLDLVVE